MEVDDESLPSRQKYVCCIFERAPMGNGGRNNTLFPFVKRWLNPYAKFYLFILFFFVNVIIFRADIGGWLFTDISLVLPRNLKIITTNATNASVETYVEDKSIFDKNYVLIVEVYPGRCVAKKIVNKGPHVRLFCKELNNSHFRYMKLFILHKSFTWRMEWGKYDKDFSISDIIYFIPNFMILFQVHFFFFHVCQWLLNLRERKGWRKMCWYSIGFFLYFVLRKRYIHPETRTNQFLFLLDVSFFFSFVNMTGEFSIFTSILVGHFHV